jgi:predicted RNA-binding protein Jag
MTKRNSFTKGQSGNPAGKPKGSISEHRKKFMEIAKLAANDAKDIYHELRECMKAGESWAYQLYVKDLIPKKSFEPTVLVKMENGRSRLEAVTTALSEFVELTHGEVLEEIKVLQNIDLPMLEDKELKITVEVKEHENLDKLSPEQIQRLKDKGRL